MTLTIVWLRSDLRLADNPSLLAAAKRSSSILPLYITDEDLADGSNAISASSKWLHLSLTCLNEQLEQLGSKLFVTKGKPGTILKRIAKETGADAVFWNFGYDAETQKQDMVITGQLKDLGIEAQSFRGNLLVEPNTIVNRQGNPFKVFTPFWKSLWDYIDSHGNVVLDAPRSIAPPPQELPQYLTAMAHIHSAWSRGTAAAQTTLQNFIDHKIDNYSSERDKIDHDGTSGLSPYLHFGEISIRQVWSVVIEHMKNNSDNPDSCRAFLRQLAWREFAFHLLYYFPESEKLALDPKFNNFPWTENEHLFSLWKAGQTGFPLVDAGMRQLESEGWIHNRLRMIVASFLVKDLLISWQSGADWFMHTLVDADIANNTLGWQWVSGCGADAAPYFRVFNPILQSKKFDPSGYYIKRFVPELRSLPSKFIHEPSKAPDSVLRAAGIKLGKTYPNPILDHNAARQRAIDGYALIK